MTEIEQFRQERNAVLFSLDEQKIKAFMRECELSVPDDKEIFWQTVHKAICNIEDAPSAMKAKSEKWLYEHGSTPEIKWEVSP